MEGFRIAFGPFARRGELLRCCCLSTAVYRQNFWGSFTRVSAFTCMFFLTALSLLKSFTDAPKKA